MTEELQSLTILVISTVLSVLKLLEIVHILTGHRYEAASSLLALLNNKISSIVIPGSKNSALFLLS